MATKTKQEQQRETGIRNVERVDRLRASGMSVPEACEKAAVKKATYGFWKTKLNKAARAKPLEPVRVVKYNAEQPKAASKKSMKGLLAPGVMGMVFGTPEQLAAFAQHKGI